MKKLSRKWLVLDHYRLAIETRFEEYGVTVKVWKPRHMGVLPSYRMRYLMDDCARALHEKLVFGLAKSGWGVKNPDWGCWDAQVTVRYDPGRKCADIYICALLCRPFSREAAAYYGERSGLGPEDRMLLMWDSREFDREGGYETVYTVAPGAAKRIFQVLDDGDIAEGVI